MTINPTPSGTHPTDDLLLFLGDVTSDAEAAALVEELRLDDQAMDSDANRAAEESHMDGASASRIDDDPLAPSVVATSWAHVRSCETCLARRNVLVGGVVAALVALPFPTDNIAVTAPGTFALDRRIDAALNVFVPNAAATPESLVRATPPRRRRFLGRGSASLGGGSSSNAVLTRPWLVGIAAVAILASVGAAFVLRPRTTERSAVGTVAPTETTPASGGRAADSLVAPSEAAAGEVQGVAAETEAAAAERTDQPASSASESAGTPSADGVRSAVAEPEAAAPAPLPARTESVVPPPPITRARSSTEASPTTPRSGNDDAISKKRAVATVRPAATLPASATASAAAAGAAELGQTIVPDLGTFVDAQSALNRFAMQYPVVSAPATAPSAATGDPTTTMFAQPAVAVAAAPATATATGSPCPLVPGDLRALARIGDRLVVLTRVAETAGPVDVVVDATTCTELARRAPLPAATTVAPPTTTVP